MKLCQHLTLYSIQLNVGWEHTDPLSYEPMRILWESMESFVDARFEMETVYLRVYSSSGEGIVRLSHHPVFE